MRVMLRFFMLIATLAIWPSMAVQGRDLHGAPCFEACQMTLKQARFTDVDEGANRRVQACESRFALTSLYLCTLLYCTIGERTAGLDAHNSTCQRTVGSSIPPFDIVIANYTEKDISRVLRLSRDNYEAPIYLGEPAIPLDNFFTLAYDTLVSWAYVHSRHIAYGAAMFVFWGVVVVIGLVNRMIVALGYRSTARRHERQSVPLCGLENISPVMSKRRTHSSRPYVWLKRFVTVPATFGYRNAQPFGWYTVPPRIQSLTILSFIVVNIVFCAHGYHVFPDNLYFPKVSTQVWRYISDRTGIISFANFPLIWLFGMRNNFLIWLTGWDFGTYNNFHRWVARVSTFQAIVHSVGYTVLVFDNGGWDLFADYWTNMWWTTGELATIFMCLLLGLSIYFIRRTKYELFLILHIMLSILVLAGMAGHVSIFKIRYDRISLVCCILWALDRISRMLRALAFNRLFWNTMAHATYDRNTNIVRLCVPFSTSLYRPKPGTSYYLQWLNDYRFWESHPFTVASVRISDDSEPLQDGSQQLDVTEDSAPLLPQEGVYQAGVSRDRISSGSTPAMMFLIRPYDGFTRRLRDAASTASPKSVKLRVLVEGPYGRTQPFHRFENIIFIAGGTGIVVPLSYLDMLCKSKNRTKTVRIIWAVREATFAATVLREDFHDLLEDNNNLWVDVYLTVDEGVSRLGKEINRVRVLHGRPQVEREVEDAIRDFQDQGSLAVVACGPMKMADDARKAVVNMLGRGIQPIEYFEESFRW